MFHRHHHEPAGDSPITAPRVRTVRLLETDEALRAAVERASAFERRGVDESQRRALSYERYLRERPYGADVVHIDSASSA